MDADSIRPPTDYLSATPMAHTGAMAAKPKYLDGPWPRAFAHRGWHIDDLAGMENSLPAFRRAWSEGFHYLETDVQVTSDGVVVVHHDPTLDRSTDSAGVISELPWSQVRQARINGVEPVSRLEDVLEELPGAYFNIDVKTDAAVEPFVDVVNRTGTVDRVAAASFSSGRLARIRKLLGDRIAMAMGPASTAAIWLNARSPVRLPLRIKGNMAQVPLIYKGIPVIRKEFVESAHRSDVEVHVWTIDDAEQMQGLLGIGVDGLVTDRPDTLRQVLQERGVWPVRSPSVVPSPPTLPSRSSAPAVRNP